MKQAIFSNVYHFFEITRDTYHYSDNRSGSPEHYLAHMLRGSCRIVSDKESITVSEGDVFYIPRGLSYQSYWYGDPEIRFLSFGFSWFPETEHTIFRLQVIPCDETIKQRLCALPAGAEPTSAALAAFFTVLSQVIPLLKTEPLDRNSRLYHAARNYLSVCPNADAGQLARQLGISESLLYSAFKVAVQKTPNTVRREILCEKAVFLLSTTDRSVQEISDALGFSSASYFRKILKAHTHMTPRDIRRTAGSV